MFQKGKILPVRDGYGKALIELGETDQNVVVLDADLAKSTRSDWFAERFPDRFIEVGIAEQNMVGVASGLSLVGLVPFVTTYSVFVTGRAFDQIRNTVCFSNLNVKIAGSHSGLSVGPDGGSHQGIEDIALMNVLPNMTILCPIDANEAYLMTLAASKYQGPVYIRLAREATEVVTGTAYPFRIGEAAVLREGKQGIILSHSVIGSEVVHALDKLSAQGFSLTHVNCSTIKPLDEKMLSMLDNSDVPIFVVEEHLQNGGLTSIIASHFARHNPKMIHSITINDCFGESGDPQELYEKYGFSSSKIASYIKNILTTKG